MKNNNIIKKLRYLIPCLMFGVASLGFQSCSDDPSGENFYTFTGEMMSDYFNNRPQYSDFAYIVNQAGLTDLLSAYGHYTCFLPDNDAIETYLRGLGKSSVSDLTQAECDTIARTHLVSNMYSTVDMNDGTLNTANMNNRYIQITHDVDSADNSVVVLNRSTHIIFAEQDDSVENGIVQPISAVLEMKNSSIGDILGENPRISIFYKALEATGLVDTLYKVRDDSYNADDYGYYYYKSHVWNEVGCPPDEKKYGFTAFVEPNDVYMKAFSDYGISVDTTSTESTLTALYNLAVQLYDPVYNSYSEYTTAKENPTDYTNRWNPLNMFIAYHILTRDCIGWNMLTPRELSGYASPMGTCAMGIRKDRMDPQDWYETLLPHTMMKLDQATVTKYLGTAIQGQRYINRRADSQYDIKGVYINPTIEDEYVQDGPNGRYFYIDGIIAFDYDTQNKVFNDRIRMDMSTVFPEIMTMNIRLNGNPKVDDSNSTADLTFTNGKNYYFPQGYLDHVTLTSGTFVYRRPHWNFDSYEGDEMNLFGDYDITFRLPPVPFEDEYQIRLGFAAESTRGVAQVYFDNKPQGIPIDMTVQLNSTSILGSKWSTKTYASMTDEEKAEDQKILKNLGYYRGAYGGFRGTSGSILDSWAEQPHTFRRILCTVHINPKTDHYLRIRCTSTSKQGNDNEFMMDYLELVPKSVYGVTAAGQMETDL